jgi:hypothetical protein
VKKAFTLARLFGFEQRGTGFSASRVVATRSRISWSKTAKSSD